MRAEEIFLKHIPEPGALRRGADWQNSIEYRSVLVIGSQGSGKSTIDEALAYALGARYHSPLKVCMCVQTGGMDVLIDVAGRNFASAYFLCAADLTLSKIPTETVNRFFQVRHVIGAQGVQRAIVVTALESHTMFGIDKNLRTDFTMMLVKTVPTNPYDRSILHKYINVNTDGSIGRRSDRTQLVDAFAMSHKDDEVLVWDPMYAPNGVLATIETPPMKALAPVARIEPKAPWGMFGGYFKKVSARHQA